jgi:DNA-directed RNA polymerase III subunit RPC1
VKKAGTLKIIHDKFRAHNMAPNLSGRKIPPKSKVLFDESFIEAKKGNTELDKHIKRAMDDLNPLKVLNLFRQIPSIDCELLGMNPREGRPEMFIWQYLPVPPICIRPSVQQDSASTEDDLTVKLADIVHISSLIRGGLQKGQPVQTIMEQWDFLQLQIAMYINSDVPGLQQPGFGKQIRGFCQRLKGKQGRFRGNLSGKRVDFSGRTVISPDPNLGVDEVAVPEKVATNLTYPERVTENNLEHMKGRVLNGLKKHPGANFIRKKDGVTRLFLKYAKERAASELEVGDIVERHLQDGDIVLFNRQPSLHKLSIMSHRVKVRPWRTFRLNECVCNPYNADFDGDEMNLHVPQTEEARVEAIELMGVKHNLLTPKNGEPIIGAIQDFITMAFLMSNKDNFFDRKTFTNICMAMVDGNLHLDLPPPAILKPEAMWTGKQVFSVLIRPNKSSPVRVNMEAKCRNFKEPDKRLKLAPDACENDGWLVIRDSEVMCGVMDKSTIGSGKKESIFFVILRDYGPDFASQAMNRLSKLSARWLTNAGFSIGISDVFPGDKLDAEKNLLVDTAYAKCDDLIKQFQAGSLERSAGCDEEQTMENEMQGNLNKVREAGGNLCLAVMSKWNSPLLMANSGSKGSKINVSQMVAVVGQQIINGARVMDGFQDRSLPHFPKFSRSPAAKGFVRNSFFSGLTPTEFLFHAMSGREGLVDTAVKTAETGYMSRRLMKSLEDLSARYDNSVRNSSSGVVQFKYGDDQLDPVDMEGNAVPVDFDRTYQHAKSLSFNHEDHGLVPWEIKYHCDRLLAKEEAKYPRYLLDGTLLDYNDTSEAANLDEFESARHFIQSIKDWIFQKADASHTLREKLGLSDQSVVPTDEGVLEMGSTYFDGSRASRIPKAAWDRISKFSLATLDRFITLCLTKYERAKVEPGSAVGAVGAQSIGEPGTQMTLKTFHFAGVAGMNLTQGVPRIKEIINASKLISTPIITCELESKTEISARVVKGRIEKTYLRDVSPLSNRSTEITKLTILDYHVDRRRLVWQLILCHIPSGYGHY